MKREYGTRDELDKLGRRLHERSQQLLSEGRIEEFVDLIHPLELARFKAFFLALGDAAEDDLVARDLLTKFDAYILRKETVETDAREVAAAYFRMVMEPPQEDGGAATQPSPAQFFADTEYHGAVPEGEHTLHVLYTPSIWPTVATYQWHHGVWKLQCRSNLAKLTAWMQRNALNLKRKGGLKDFMHQMAEVQVTKLEVIGSLVSDSWAFVVYRLESVAGDFATAGEAVHFVSSEDPAWPHLDDRAELEAIVLRDVIERTGALIVPLVKATAEAIEGLEKLETSISSSGKSLLSWTTQRVDHGHSMVLSLRDTRRSATASKFSDTTSAATAGPTGRTKTTTNCST